MDGTGFFTASSNEFIRQSDNLTFRLAGNKSKSVTAILCLEARKSSQEMPKLDWWLAFAAEIR